MPRCGVPARVERAELEEPERPTARHMLRRWYAARTAQCAIPTKLYVLRPLVTPALRPYGSRHESLAALSHDRVSAGRRRPR